MTLVKAGFVTAALLCAAGRPLAAESPAVSTAAPAAAADFYKDMVLIPPGEFLMGSEEKDFPNERPRRKVYLDAYYIDKYEVTAASYRLFTQATGRPAPRQTFPDKDRYPAVYMTWKDAMAYCEFHGKRLPTEAQWEKAARGGSEGRYSFGDDKGQLGAYAWHWGNSGKTVHPVGGRKPNGYGLYDMEGNVLEWTADWYDPDYYSGGPAVNPQGPAEGREKVIRGGSAFVSADLCRPAARMRSGPDTRYSVKGFRCAAALPAKTEPPTR